MQIGIMDRLSNEVYARGGHMCPGCGSHVASQIVMRALAKRDDVYVEGNACGWGNTSFPSGVGYGGGTNMGTTGGSIAGFCASIKVQGFTGKKKLVMVGGEGSNMCMGLGNILHAFMRQFSFTLIIPNNESFAEAGNHITSLSPLKAADKSLLTGKDFPSLPVSLLCVMAGAKYVATATYSYPEDLIAKIDKALENQPSLVDILCACPTGWRYPAGMAAQITRLAVRTDLYPLWESLRDEDNKIHLQRTVRIEDRLPITEYTKLQRRFRHVTEADVADLNTYLDEQADTLNRMEQAFP